MASSHHLICACKSAMSGVPGCSCASEDRLAKEQGSIEARIELPGRIDR